MSQSLIHIRHAKQADFLEMAHIHKEALPTDLLPRLGTSYLEKTFYKKLQSNAYGFILVAEAKEKVIGFIIVAPSCAATSYLREIKEFFNLLLCIFTKPQAWLGAIQVIFSKTEPPQLKQGFEKEIIAFAISKRYQGKGVGRLLINSAVEQITSHPLTTRTASQSAQAFYSHLGFTVIGTEYRLKKTFIIMQNK